MPNRRALKRRAQALGISLEGKAGELKKRIADKEAALALVVSVPPLASPNHNPVPGQGRSGLVGTMRGLSEMLSLLVCEVQSLQIFLRATKFSL